MDDCLIAEDSLGDSVPPCSCIPNRTYIVCIVSWSGARSCVGAGVGASDEAPSPLPSLDRGPSVHVTLRELGACEVVWLSREPRPGWRGLGSSRIHRCFTLEPPLSEAPPSCGAFPGLSIHLFTAPIRPRVPEIYARSCLAHTSTSEVVLGQPLGHGRLVTRSPLRVGSLYLEAP